MTESHDRGRRLSTAELDTLRGLLDMADARLALLENEVTRIRQVVSRIGAVLGREH